MADVAKVRFVRCPKCHNLLPEFADVPMYQCGGCGAILQAKNYNISKESASLGLPVTHPSQSVSNNESSNDGSTTLEKINQTFRNRSSTSSNAENYCHEKAEFSGTDENRESANAEEHDTFRNSFSTSANAENYCHEKGEFLGTDEHSESANDASCHSEERSFDSTSLVDFSCKDEDERIQAKTECSSSDAEEEEKSWNLSEAQSNSLSSPAAAAASDRVPDKYRLMSRRTFRHQWGSSSGTSEARTSLGSESFHSVQSSIRTENEEPARSLSKGLPYFHKDSSEHQNGSTSTRLKNLNNNRSELMKLIGELKDQLSIKNARSHFSGVHPIQQMPLSYLHCHLQPNSCCNNSSHRTCSYNFCCYLSKIGDPIQHTSHKARPAKRFFRPVSGGAPFVTCYKCFKVLHIPVDFLVSTKRLNKLKCGSCYEILVLSFPARAHPVPQASAETGDSSQGPVSFSEGYGISLAESCSTQTESALNTSRVSSDESRSEKGSGLPLHKVMGYSSARHLLN